MDTKSLLTSKTFWGTVVQIAAMVLMFLKIDIGAQEGWVEAIMGLIGAGLAIYGRIKAVTKIG